ncbi:MAG: class I SAM-dependent methyltransferase, partial [Gammaproteobacteria bacterium]
IELGCGTGRLAARLLGQYLPASASYVGVDISSTMVRLATERVAPWADRATIHLTGGEPVYSRYGGPFDRFVSTYVFDLLSDEDIAAVLAAAHECLENGGRLCVAGLTEGSGLSAITTKAWHLVRRIRPALVGGCRPLLLARHLPEDQWRIVFRQVVVNAMVPSEVLIAEAA